MQVSFAKKTDCLFGEKAGFICEKKRIAFVDKKQVVFAEKSGGCILRLRRHGN